MAEVVRLEEFIISRNFGWRRRRDSCDVCELRAPHTTAGAHVEPSVMRAVSRIILTKPAPNGIFI
jgi:hypothetical protein